MFAFACLPACEEKSPSKGAGAEAATMSLNQARARTMEIMEGVAEGQPNFMTPAVHEEFKQLYARVAATKEDQETLRVMMIDIRHLRTALFFRDVLESFRQKTPIRSATRAKVEARLLEVLPEAAKRFTKDEAKLRDVAADKGMASPSGKPETPKAETFQAIVAASELATIRLEAFLDKGPTHPNLPAKKLENPAKVFDELVVRWLGEN